jgi:hypothetical protein
LKFLNFRNKINFNKKCENELFNFLINDTILKKHNKKYFYYSFFKKNIEYRKIFRKGINGRIRNIKNDSYKKDKNNTIINKFFNVSMENGNKLNLLKHWNIFIANFFESFKIDNEGINHYKNYNTLFDLFQSKKNHYNFILLLNKSLTIFEPLFNVKIDKANKKIKTKYNKKYVYKIIYIKKKKRLKHVLKLMNAYSERFQNYNY